MFSIMGLDTRLALTVAMRQAGIILQANVFKVTLKTISVNIVQSAEDGFMRVRVGL